MRITLYFIIISAIMLFMAFFQLQSMLECTNTYSLDKCIKHILLKV